MLTSKLFYFIIVSKLFLSISQNLVKISLNLNIKLSLILIFENFMSGNDCKCFKIKSEINKTNTIKNILNWRYV